MADDKTQTGARDRAEVAASEPYEVADFATAHDMTQAQARTLIAEVGSNRAKLDAAAKARGRPNTAALSVSTAGSATEKPASRRGAATTKTGTPTRRAITATAKISNSTSGTSRPATRLKPRAATVRTGAVGATPQSMLETVSGAAPTIAAVTKPVRRTARASARTVTKAAAPVTSRVTKAASEVAARVSATARDATTRVQKAPAAARKSASSAVDSVKAAAATRTAAVLGAAAAGLVTGLAVNLARKTVVQAPSVMAGDWLEAVKLEHKLALSLFDAIEGTTNDQPAKRTMLLIQLTHALSKHAFTEENVIYPALRDWGDKADADKLNHDHGYVKQHLYDLDAIDPASSAFLAKIATFRADLEAHIEEEETAVFPPLHAALGDAKNAKITALANKEGFKLA